MQRQGKASFSATTVTCTHIYDEPLVYLQTVEPSFELINCGPGIMMVWHMQQHGSKLYKGMRFFIVHRNFFSKICNCALQTRLFAKASLAANTTHGPARRGVNDEQVVY